MTVMEFTNFSTKTHFIPPYPYSHQWIEGWKAAWKVAFEESFTSFQIETRESIGVCGSGSCFLCLTEKGIGKRVVQKEINIDELERAMHATDEEVNQWLRSLLEDYDIEPNAENIEEVSFFIKLWLEQQAFKRGLKLKEEELEKLFKFAICLAYKTLYVGSL